MYLAHRDPIVRERGRTVKAPDVYGSLLSRLPCRQSTVLTEPPSSYVLIALAENSLSFPVGKLAGVSPPIDNVVETQCRNDPPDKDIDGTPCAVMTGDLYQLMVTVSAKPGLKDTNTMKVGLDTCSGINLIRRSQIPHGTKIRCAPGVTKVRAAQGQNVDMIGEVTLSLTVCGSQDVVAVDFVVVDALVVPALLGTPWIDKYVWSIDPPEENCVVTV